MSEHAQGPHTVLHQKSHQAEHFDHEITDPEFEVVRPRGAKFYSFLMHYKVGTALSLVGRDLAGARVLCVCAGSGMDAELLLQHGSKVVCLDVSSGALLRARERAQRFGLDYALVTGDAECLPFPEHSFDYVFVHDGLHHLTDPEGAIAEMARVGRQGVIITEPADVLLTGLLIRLGLIDRVEEAGNHVFRFPPARLTPLFRRLGLPEVRSRRYLVKYPHKPGIFFKLLDLPLIYHLAKSFFLLFGAFLFGRFGNKLAIVALAGDASGGQGRR